MTSARDRYGDDDPGAQILASVIAFRGWALAHPVEFGLIFANTAVAEAAQTAETAETAETADLADPTATSSRSCSSGSWPCAPSAR